MDSQKAAITFEDVLAATHELRAAGLKISILAVREKLGRGSFSTVKKHLERIDGADKTQDVKAIPAQLESLWNEARKAADEALQRDRLAVEALSMELEARLESMQATVGESNHARTQAEVRLADRSAELERALAQIDDLRAERDRGERRWEAAEKELEDEKVRSRSVQSALFDLQNSVTQLLANQAATADLVGSSARSVAADLAEFIAIEREARVSAHELLRRDARDLLAPLSSTPGSLNQIERVLQSLSRGLTGPGWQARLRAGIRSRGADRRS